MSEKKVEEYAQELGLENEELISRLQEYGLQAESPSSLISEEDIRHFRPELYRHTGGSMILSELAARLGFSPEFVEESVRILNNDPHGSYDCLDTETIEALTGSKESLRVKDLGARLQLSPRKTLKLLKKLGRPAFHSRSRIDSVTVNVLLKTRLSGTKDYLRNKRKLRFRRNNADEGGGKYSYRIGRIFITVSVTCFLFTVGYFAYGFYGLTKMSQPERISLAKNDNHGKPKIIKASKPINVLLLGIEATDWEHKARSDTIMVARIDPANNDVTILSIPRDSRVFIKKYGNQKLTHAYFYGESPLVRKTITESFGIPIDRCVEVHFQGFYEIVEFLGGVDIEVEKSIRSPRFWNFRPFTIPAGKQHLNAKEALAYVHFRFDKMGDIGRIERQQNFVRAVTKQVKKTKNLIELPIMMNQLASHLRTDMSVTEMLSWAKLLWNIDLDEVKTETLPGYPKMIYDKWAGKKLSYWIVDHDEADPIIESIFDISLEEEDKNPEKETKNLKADDRSEKQNVSSKEYAVRNGDTVSSIAEQFGIKVDDLIKANPKIADPSRIVVGETLVIPLDLKSNPEAP